VGAHETTSKEGEIELIAAGLPRSAVVKSSLSQADVIMNLNRADREAE
jgi:hypothetical protein